MNRVYANAHDARCSEPGCKSKPHARGVCQKHYRRESRSRLRGTPTRHDGLVRVVVRGWGSL